MTITFVKYKGKRSQQGKPSDHTTGLTSVEGRKEGGLGRKRFRLSSKVVASPEGSSSMLGRNGESLYH